MSSAYIARSTTASPRRRSGLRWSSLPEHLARGSNAVRNAAPPAASRTPLRRYEPSCHRLSVRLRFLDLFGLFGGKALGVRGVPSVAPDVEEPACALLARLRQQDGLVEGACGIRALKDVIRLDIPVTWPLVGRTRARPGRSSAGGGSGHRRSPLPFRAPLPPLHSPYFESGTFVRQSSFWPVNFRAPDKRVSPDHSVDASGIK